MTTTTTKKQIDYKSEIKRKGIHFLSLSIPITYYYISREAALKTMLPFLLFFLLIDLLKKYNKSFYKFYTGAFGSLLRAHEKDTSRIGLSSATYVFISAFIVIFTMPKIMAITGLAILILSDIAAALIGRKYGKHKFLAKSREGSLAFFVTACLVILVAPKIEGLLSEYIIGFIAAGFGTISENLSNEWADDNFTIPITIGITMWVLYTIFLPELDFTRFTIPW